jgi:hypothetical protein
MDPDDLAALGPLLPIGRRSWPLAASPPLSRQELLAQGLKLYGSPEAFLGSAPAPTLPNPPAGQEDPPGDAPIDLSAWPALGFRRSPGPLDLADGLQRWPFRSAPDDQTTDTSGALASNPVGPPATNLPSAAPSAASPPQHYSSWMLPDGQVVQEDDFVQGDGVTYHHGSLAGAPGVFVDNSSDPAHPEAVFTPIPSDGSLSDHGFTPSPVLGPNGEHYFEKSVWSDGNRRAILQVDAQGRPVTAYTRDAGRADPAPGLADIFGPADIELPLEAGLAAAKFGLPLLAKGMASKLAAVAAGSTAKDAGETAAAAAETAASAARPTTEPDPTIIQLGGAHRDVRKLADYDSHHMPGDRVSPLPREEGPAIAMLPTDHRATEGWGNYRRAQVYRARQAALIAKGDLWGAMQMDIEDIETKFPGKYSAAIAQAVKYARDKGLIN